MIIHPQRTVPSVPMPEPSLRSIVVARAMAQAERSEATRVVVRGMNGLGDNIFQRPFVRVLARTTPVYLQTPWPELYGDLPGVTLLPAQTVLRTQHKNVTRQKPTAWGLAPRGANVAIVNVSYGHASLRAKSIVQVMEECFGVAPDHFDLPRFPAYHHSKPIALIRPATERAEWHNVSRGPLPEYITHIAATLMDDYHVISVADLQSDAEWLVGGIEPPAHVRYHHGELSVEHLLGLVQSAAVVVGGVGWIVPACTAAGTPLFCVLGGCGGHNAPEKITDPRMDLSHVGYATPEHFCRCDQMRHECNKRIPDLHNQWATWRKRQRL